MRPASKTPPPAREASGPKAESTPSSSRYPKIAILRHDKECHSNIAKFEKDIAIASGLEFGDLFTFAKTGSYPTFESPHLTDIDEQEILDRAKAALLPPGPEQDAETQRLDDLYDLTASEKYRFNKMYEERWKAELKSVEDAKRRFKENKPKLYWLIRAHMSPESIDRVRAKMLDEFDQLEIMQDPLILWTNTKATHTAYGSGVDFTDASRAEARYHGIKQHERESLSSFKERLETMVKAMQALGLDLPSEQRQAAHLLTKVNSTFEPAARKIEDNYRLSGPYPATTFEA